MSLKKSSLHEKHEEAEEKPLIRKDVADVLKVVLLIAVAAIIAGVYEANPPVNTMEELLTIGVICGLLYFWMQNKRES